MPSERPGKSPDGSDWHKVRLWHIQPVRDVLVLALIFGILYLGYVLRPITVPMLIALMMAYLFEPLMKRMTRSRHVSRQGAAAAIIAGFFFVVIVPIGVGLGVGVTQAVVLVENVAQKTTDLVRAVNIDNQTERTASIAELPRGWRFLGEKFDEVRVDILKRREAERVRDQRDESKEKKPDGPLPQEGATPQKPVDAPVKPAEAPENPPATEPVAGDAAAKPDDAPAEAVPATSHTDASTGEVKETEEEPDDVRVTLYSALYSGVDWIRANASNVAKSVGQTAITTGQGAIAMVAAFLGGLAFLAFSAFLTAFFFFFFSTGWGKVLDFWANLIPERKKGRAFDLIAKMDRVIAGFVRGRLTICAIMGIFHTLAYWLIGVPMPIVVGTIAGLLYIVPFLHVLTIPIGILLLWLEPSSLQWQNTWWWILFAPIVVDVAGQFLDDWVLSPVIQGKTTEMDMPTILFASMAGGALAGMYGLLLAIPVAACIKILVKELFWPKFRKWARGEERDFLPISAAEDAPKKGK